MKQALLDILAAERKANPKPKVVEARYKTLPCEGGCGKDAQVPTSFHAYWCSACWKEKPR